MDLITGGSGYFGSHLIKKLLKTGRNCRNFDLINFDEPFDDVEFYQGDIRDEKAILKACQGVDTVYHNVAQVPLAKDKHEFRSVNIDGTKNLLKACLATKVKKLIYLSSSAVFGAPQTNPVNEQTSPTPAEAYGQAKLEAEQLCLDYANKGLDVTIIRPRTILGHGRLGIFQILFEWIRDGYNVPVLGKGDNIYQFVHADDLAEACLLAGEKTGSTIYNIGSENFGTMKETLTKLVDYAQTGSRVIRIPMKPALLGMKITSALGLSPLGAYHALMYGRSLYFDISKAKNELNWLPKYSNEEMMIQSYDWYIKNREKVFNGKIRSYHRSPVKEGILWLFKKIVL